MKIVKLTPEQFDNFSISHPLHTYYQTSAYGNLMSLDGFEPHYYGFTNDQNILIGPKYINENKELIHFDGSIAAPPLNLRMPSNLINNSYNLFKYGEIGSTSTDWGFVSSVLGSLNKKGRAAVFLANGSLFGAGNRKRVRNNVLRDDKIEAIISFPERFFVDALIPINLMVFNNHKTNMKNKIILFLFSPKNLRVNKPINIGIINKTIAEINNLKIIIHPFLFQSFLHHFYY